MSNFKVIPAIDLINGKCVRLKKGDYNSSKTYNQDPLDMAKSLEAAGLEYLHVVDLDGAKSGKIVNFPVLEAICSKTKLKVDFGGGLKKDEDLKIAFESGAKQVSIGSVAVKDPGLFLKWIDLFHAERIILSADAQDGMVAINAWQDISNQPVMEFIQSYQKHGIMDVVCTDISKDGMLEGPGYELYEMLISKLQGINLIASGGVKNLEDLKNLKKMNMAGAIVGKAMYEGRISLEEMLMV
ncbi:MAG: 1-(5-phosphoribosyl)-5-[(5-phosphoribosylamino)methylideneamino]imidazole-4-carboxamide isomerase [Bacteroidia bacterium]|nr:1-(5-phosphoribosyl)-5-[(5-phosphoribosylamino)methylideneamino]imidazole-4-carboxamide isomerase [Bacteroidia bacterium]